MVDIEAVRKDPQKFKEAAKQKGFTIDIDKLLKLDTERRRILQEIEGIRAKKNELTKTIGTLPKDKRTKALAALKKIDPKEDALRPKLQKVEKDWADLLASVPNLPLAGAPIGKNEKDNKIVKTWVKPPKFSFKPLDHVELGKRLDILDFETGSKVAGSGFYYLKNEGVFLELALVRYALDFLTDKGFVPWITPDLAESRFPIGTGYLPRGPEAQTYEIRDMNLSLIATAEVTLAGVHADEILEERELPKRYAGYSHSFRQEAGSYGKYSKGLFRVHQFTKVEMFAYTTAEESSRMHKELLELEEELWRGLKIPYRVVEMCTGDLGAQAAQKFDLEAWMPGRGDWGEVTSTSNTTDYQARRLGIRYRTKDGKVVFAHTLNGTAIATSRALIAILENYQQKDGSVKVPAILQQYVSFKEIKPKA